MVMAMRIVAFLAIACSPLLANTYYVSPTGNDGNPGTQGSPLLTIQAGVNKAHAGDLVMVLAGTYDEEVTFPRSGTEGFPITVRGEVDGGGNPLAVIDNAASITATWIAAPEVGSGVYKAKLGYEPLMMLLDSEQVLRLTDELMAGDSVRVGGVWPGTGFNILASPANWLWANPFGQQCTVAFWDGVEAAYGYLNDTTYIRFKDGDDPNTKNLRGNDDYRRGFFLDLDSFITLGHLRIQGTYYPVFGDSASSCVIENCVVRNGVARVSFQYGHDNIVKDNDLSRGAFGLHYGPWESIDASFPGDAPECIEAYLFAKYMDGDLGGINLAYEDGDEISGNSIHNTHVGIHLNFNATHTSIHDNTISQLSSTGIEEFPVLSGKDSSRFFDNTFKQCAIGIRISAIGYEGDSCREAFIYNNRFYNDVARGAGIVFHEAVDYDYNIINGLAKAPNIWFYHNSWAGGTVWGGPNRYACSRMKFLNNIMSMQYMIANMAVADVEDSFLVSSFDYNFLGGDYNYYGLMVFATTDSHNIWDDDTVGGDTAHQVWPLGSEPYWVVPYASPAYHAGLDLSHPFILRGTTYGPLPGVAPDYFPGLAPNLGAVQDRDDIEVPQQDPGHGSISPLPEFAFAPNPATCRDVVVRCTIPTMKIGKLTMRDVVGRTVKSISLPPSRMTRLDLRGLAPGVYMAALDGTVPLVFRKLVITSR